MLKDFREMMGQKGSMMVEALAMLGLISMVTPMLYKKAAERTTELADINAAAAARTLSSAMESYLAANQAELSKLGWGEGAHDLDPEEQINANFTKFTDYLPEGYMRHDEAGKIFDGYKLSINVKQNSEGKPTYTGMVALPMIGTVDKVRRSKIASMIGGNGGLVEKDDAGLYYSGVQGLWMAEPDDFFKDSPLDEGTIVAATVSSVGAGGSGGGIGADENALYRNDVGDIERNTMNTTLYMGGQEVEDVTNLVAESGGVISLMAADRNNDGSRTVLSVSGKTEMGSLLAEGLAEIRDKLAVGPSGSEYMTVDSSGTKVNNDLTAVGSVLVGSEATRPDSFKVITKDINLNAENELGFETKNNLKFKADDKIIMDANLFDWHAPLGEMAIGNLVLGNDGTTGYLSIGEGSNGVTIRDDADFNMDLLAHRNVTFDGKENGVFDVYMKDIKLHAMNDLNWESDKNINLKAAQSMTMEANRVQISAQADGINMQAINSSVMIESLYGPSSYGKIELGQNNKGAVQISAIGGIAEIRADNGMLLSSGKDVKIESTGGDVDIDANKDVLIGKSASVTYLQSDETLATGDFIVKRTGSDGTDGVEILHVDPSVDASPENLPSSVYIRKGAIEVAQSSNDSGYVKANRFIDTMERPSESVAIEGIDGMGIETGKYDKYEINPAYTSIMHDIKLTTRGGARLSDILPDFILKGIYVMDNTYKETFKTAQVGTDEVVSLDWVSEIGKGASPLSASGTTVTVSAPMTTDANELTSPWLGYVPTPQCPPAYKKVITLNPIRWKMAEMYRVTMNAPGVSGSSGTGKNPTDWLYGAYMPKRFPVEVDLSGVTVADGKLIGTGVLGSFDDSGAIDENSLPPTFQTNTWLNTTVAAAKTGTDFYGWHAIMGFIYNGNYWDEYVKEISGSYYEDVTGKIIWNLFPVLPREMMAIAQTYCYFDKRPAAGVDDTFVDDDIPEFDGTKISNIRIGNGDDKTNKDGLDDPTLGFKSPW